MDKSGAATPIGASGVRLETDVHVISVSSTALYALQKCCERAGLYLNGAYYGALAAAEAVLTPEEKELGVVVLDIGAGTTSVAAFLSGCRLLHRGPAGGGGKRDQRSGRGPVYPRSRGRKAETAARLCLDQPDCAGRGD